MFGEIKEQEVSGRLRIIIGNLSNICAGRDVNCGFVIIVPANVVVSQSIERVSQARHEGVSQAVKGVGSCRRTPGQD